MLFAHHDKFMAGHGRQIRSVNMGQGRGIRRRSISKPPRASANSVHPVQDIEVMRHPQGESQDDGGIVSVQI